MPEGTDVDDPWFCFALLAGMVLEEAPESLRLSQASLEQGLHHLPLRIIIAGAMMDPPPAQTVPRQRAAHVAGGVLLAFGSVGNVPSSISGQCR